MLNWSRHTHKSSSVLIETVETSWTQLKMPVLPAVLCELLVMLPCPNHEPCREQMQNLHFAGSGSKIASASGVVASCHVAMSCPALSFVSYSRLRGGQCCQCSAACMLWQQDVAFFGPLPLTRRESSESSLTMMSTRFASTST